VPKKHRAAPSRVIDGAAVVIQSKLSEVSLLNEVGTLVWGAIDGAKSEADLARLVTESFEVTHEQAARDVSAFLDELAAANLVEFVA
jgi:hypothetical protein